MRAEGLTISRLAAAGSVNVETVRYYQRRGLLSEPERPLGGIRRYGQVDIARLRFIRRSKAMGFSLDAIAEMLRTDGKHACETTRALATRKLADVRRRVIELQQLEEDLVRLVDECHGVVEGDPCPVLASLARLAP